MKTFVINLPEQSARRDQIGARLTALDIDHEIVDGVDGRRLSPEALAAHYDAGRAAHDYREMSPSEIGCALSHLEVYRRIVARELPFALVLEDDAAPDADLPPVLAALAERADAQSREVVLLNHVDKYTQRGMLALDDRHRLVRPYGYWWRAHGYVVTQAAARALLDGLDPVSAAADHWIEFERRGLVTLRAVVPFCIALSPLAEQSSIEALRAEQVRRDPRPRSWRYRLHRWLWQRFLHQIVVRPFLRVARQPRHRTPPLP